MTLYEFSMQAQQLLEILTTPDEEMTGEDVQQAINDTLASMGLNDKLDSYGKLIRQMTSNVEAVKAEKQRLATLQSYLENNTQRLKDSLLMFMETTSIDSYDTDIFRFRVRKSKAVNVTDIDAIPEEFKKLKIDVDKAALKKALISNDITGAELIENRSVIIK